MKKIITILPLLGTIILFIFLLIFLLQSKDPSKPPSALLNKKIPEFISTSLMDENVKLNHQDISSKITLINFFASWCAPCKIEHPFLLELKNNFPELMIIGIDHKDKKEDAIKFLSKDGNPYNFVGIDADGKIGIEFGVFGLPETFLTNNKGKIIFKHIGPLSKEIIQNEIIPNL